MKLKILDILFESLDLDKYSIASIGKERFSMAEAGI